MQIGPQQDMEQISRISGEPGGTDALASSINIDMSETEHEDPIGRDNFKERGSAKVCI